MTMYLIYAFSTVCLYYMHYYTSNRFYSECVWLIYNAPCSQCWNTQEKIILINLNLISKKIKYFMTIFNIFFKFQLIISVNIFIHCNIAHMLKRQILLSKRIFLYRCIFFTYIFRNWMISVKFCFSYGTLCDNAEVVCMPIMEIKISFSIFFYQKS